MKNAGDGTHFSKKDVVFECFHNFVALSQWGNTIFGIMSRLSEDGGDAGIVSEDDEWKFRQRQWRTLSAIGAVRHGIVPPDLAEWRKHLSYSRC